MRPAAIPTAVTGRGAQAVEDRQPLPEGQDPAERPGQIRLPFLPPSRPFLTGRRGHVTCPDDGGLGFRQAPI